MPLVPPCNDSRRASSSQRRVRRLTLGVLGLVTAASISPTVAAVADSPSPTPTSSQSGTGAGASDPNRVTFGIQPASPDTRGVIVPDQRPYLYYAGAPGSTIQDHVAIINYGTKPITARVYSADARNDAQGGFTLLTGEQKSSDAGSWTSMSVTRRSVTVAGRTTAADSRQAYGVAILPVTIKIPAAATPGDHVGGVLVSVVSAGSQQQGANVQLDQRVGTRMFIRVAGALDPQMDIENVSATYDGPLNPVGKGSATVSFTVANRGNVKLGGRITVRVTGLLGRTSDITLPDLPLLLPGNSVDLTAQVPDVVPQLRNSATVTLTPLKLQSDSDPDLPDVVASTSFWAIPWTLLAAMVLVAILGWSLWRRRRTPAPAAAVGSRERRPVEVA
jgi:hypothetical protein